MDIRIAGLEDAESIGRIQVASWQSAYKNIVPDVHLNSMDVAAHASRWTENLSTTTQNKFTLMAAVDGRDIGFLSMGPARDENAGFDGELWAVYLHPDFYGQGHGKPFFDDAVSRMKKQGYKNMYVWVLKDNMIGRRFYEKMGAVEIKGLTKTVTIADTVLDEVAYGWISL